MLAIVPVKGRDGKSRLGDVLSREERARLVRGMLADVLAACHAARSVTGVLVVTPDDELVPNGVDVLLDDGTGHADAVARGLAAERVRADALVVMGDCPLVTADALDRLAESASPVALVPAYDGGMNALALRAAAPFEPAFGVPRAAAVTVARARAAGVEPVVLQEATLAFDVDTPPDVARLRESTQRTRAEAALADAVVAQP